MTTTPLLVPPSKTNLSQNAPVAYSEVAIVLHEVRDRLIATVLAMKIAEPNGHMGHALSFWRQGTEAAFLRLEPQTVSAQDVLNALAAGTMGFDATHSAWATEVTYTMNGEQKSAIQVVAADRLGEATAARVPFMIQAGTVKSDESCQVARLSRNLLEVIETIMADANANMAIGSSEAVRTVGDITIGDWMHRTYGATVVLYASAQSERMNILSQQSKHDWKEYRV